MIHFLNLRNLLKHYLLSPMRTVLRRILTYSQRIERWGIILVQMRGITITDQLKLFASALVAPIISLRQIDYWQNPHLFFDINVIVFGIGQFSLRRHTDDLWHVLPWRERAVMKIIRGHLKQGHVFIDAGANIGFYTIIASKLVGTPGKIVSIEMVPETAKILRYHCEINNLTNVEIFECALFDNSNQKILARVPIGSYGQASIGNVNMNGEIHEIEVKTSTLDELLADIAEIKLIKMDIEGAEIVAIKGANKILRRTLGIIYEQWNIKEDNHDEVSARLIEMGFSISCLDGRNLLAQKNYKYLENITNGR